MANDAGVGWQLAQAVYEYREPGGPALGDLPARVALLRRLSDRLSSLENQDAFGEVAQSLAHAGLASQCREALSNVTSNLDEDEVNFTGYAHIRPTHWSKAALGLARAGCREAAIEVTERCAKWLDRRWDSDELRAHDRLEQVRIMVGEALPEDLARADTPKLLAEGGRVGPAIRAAMQTDTLPLRTQQLAEVARMCARVGDAVEGARLVAEALDLAKINMACADESDGGPVAWEIARALARLGKIQGAIDWLHECLNRHWIDWTSRAMVSVAADGAASGNPAAGDLIELLPKERLRDSSLTLTNALIESGDIEAARDVAKRCYLAAMSISSYGDENVDVCSALAVTGLIASANKAWKETRDLRNTGMFSIRNHTFFQGHLAAGWVLQGELDKAIEIADAEKNSSLWSVDPVAYISRALILGRAELRAR